MEEINVLLITQARLGSTRFPNKVLKPILDTTLLGLHLRRIQKSKYVRNIVVATTFEEGIESVIEEARFQNVNVFQGSMDHVLDRFYKAALPFQPDYVIRVTSDCPLIDAVLIDQVLVATVDGGFDYGSNAFFEQYPDGQDIEVFKFWALEKACQEAQLLSDKEHVTPYIIKNSDIKGGQVFKAFNYPSTEDYKHVRMTVDTPDDYQAVLTLVNQIGGDATWQMYAAYIKSNFQFFDNQVITRNEGYIKSLKNDRDK